MKHLMDAKESLVAARGAFKGLEGAWMEVLNTIESRIQAMDAARWGGDTAGADGPDDD